MLGSGYNGYFFSQVCFHSPNKKSGLRSRPGEFPVSPVTRFQILRVTKIIWPLKWPTKLPKEGRKEKGGRSIILCVTRILKRTNECSQTPIKQRRSRRKFLGGNVVIRLRLTMASRTSYTGKRSLARKAAGLCTSIWKFNPQRRKPDKRWAISKPKNRKTDGGFDNC